MSGDEYVSQVLKKYEVLKGQLSPAEQTANKIAPVIRRWAGSWLHSIGFSGSYAKGTAVRGGSDIDIFISLKSDTPGTLKDNYDKLAQFASQNGWSPRRQNVSIGVNNNGVAVDLVPARIQAGYQNWHSLYKSKSNNWTQTNVALHISTVGNSNRIDEIRAIKIWRNLRGIDFPSFYLELTVINALYGHRTNTLASNVLTALRYIADSLPSARVDDPANTNNCISADLTLAEKQTIASKARVSAQAPNWGEIIW